MRVKGRLGGPKPVLVLPALVLLLVVQRANCEISTVAYQVSAGADDGYAWSATG